MYELDTRGYTQVTIRNIVLIVAWLLLVGAQVEAQIYKWVDEKGTVHFSQSPPPGGTAAGGIEAIPDAAAAPMVQGQAKPAAQDDDEEIVDRTGEGEPEPGGDGDGEDEYLPEDDAAPDDVMVDDGTGDPRVWLRSRSPANEAGQPIQQPGAGAGLPRAFPRRAGRR
jgi:hypothetical protein